MYVRGKFTIICERCGTEREMPFCKRERKYCSRDCNNKNRAKTMRYTAHPLYKGGRMDHGYHTTLMPDGSYKSTHRLVVENNTGKKLGKNEVVHHVNGLKTDNRIENLVVMTAAEHTSLHRRERIN